MKYFYDCEFIEDGYSITLVSIGIWAEDNRAYYAVSNEFDPKKANIWVEKNVLPQLPSAESELWKNRKEIKRDIENFMKQDQSKIEMWAWIGAYDHVCLCQLWGDMTALPRYMPRFTHELRQFWEDAGSPRLPKAENAHNALSDAKNNYDKYMVIKNHTHYV